MMSQVPRVQFQRRNVQDDTLKSLPSNVQDDKLKNVQGDTLKSLPSRLSDPGERRVSDNTVGQEAHEPTTNTPMGRLRDLSLQLEGALPEAEVRNPPAINPKSSTLHPTP